MFHEKLKNKRLACNFSQRYVAEYLNISPQSISKWENGSALPSIEFLPLLAECFDCSIDDFFKEHNEENDVEAIKAFWEIAGDIVLERKEIDDIIVLAQENPGIIDKMDNICDVISQRSVVNSHYIAELFSCSLADAKIILDHLVKCELVKYTEVSARCVVDKDSVDGMKIVFKAYSIILKLKMEKGDS